VVHNDKLFKNNPDLEIFEKEYTDKEISSEIIGSSEKCIDQLKQPCHTVEAVKLTEHEMKTRLEGLVKMLFGKKIKYKWVCCIDAILKGRKA
jgi:phenylalanyl-tRNA synthetase alpha chain